MIKSEAAKRLGELGDARAVDPLIIALKDITDLVRSAAAKALGKIRDARAVEPLTEALDDSDWYVPQIAARALAQIANTRAVKSLIEAFIKGQEMDGPKHYELTQIIVRSLEQLLEAKAGEISLEDLRNVADFEDRHYKWITTGAGCGGPQIPKEEDVSCSLARQLARQELIRRGLKA